MKIANKEDYNMPEDIAAIHFVKYFNFLNLL